MSTERPAIEPIRSAYGVQLLTGDQLDDMQEATLRILEEVGVKFPSERALAIFADHGAGVDHETQTVRIPRDMVRQGIVEPARPMAYRAAGWHRRSPL